MEVKLENGKVVAYAEKGCVLVGKNSKGVVRKELGWQEFVRLYKSRKV